MHQSSCNSVITLTNINNNNYVCKQIQILLIIKESNEKQAMLIYNTTLQYHCCLFKNSQRQKLKGKKKITNTKDKRQIEKYNQKKLYQMQT